MPLDELDFNILRCLSEDSRTSLQGIAKKMKVSEGTIRNRLARMESDKVILGHALLLDHAKLGFASAALIGISVEPAKFFSVIQELGKIEEVRSVTSCTGEYPVIIEVWKANSEQMGKFISEKINSMPGVTAVSPNLVVERVKTGKGPLRPY
ncbi:MAG: Lrp/AsnC family transcriptional regulator [Candidatus Micrarchaeota archaeon]